VTREVSHGAEPVSATRSATSTTSVTTGNTTSSWRRSCPPTPGWPAGSAWRGRQSQARPVRL